MSHSQGLVVLRILKIPKGRGKLGAKVACVRVGTLGLFVLAIAWAIVVNDDDLRIFLMHPAIIKAVHDVCVVIFVAHV